MAPALGALGVAGALHLPQLAAQLGDLGVDPAAVGLDLGLTGATAADARARGDPATGLARQVAAPAAQALLHVVELGQLDLRLALARLRVLGEDVEDQRGPVDDLDLEPVLEVAQLAGRELAVADHGVGAGRLHDLADAVDLAATDVRRGVGRLPALVDRLEHLGAGGLGEQRELGHRVLGVLDGAVGPDADQHHPLEAQLAVLDLADVLELGGQAGDPAQRVPLGELHRADGGRLLGVGLVGPVRTRPSHAWRRARRRGRSRVRSSYVLQGRPGPCRSRPDYSSTPLPAGDSLSGWVRGHPDAHPGGARAQCPAAAARPPPARDLRRARRRQVHAWRPPGPHLRRRWWCRWTASTSPTSSWPAAGLLDRKGAPDSFDGWGYAALLGRLARRPRPRRDGAGVRAPARAADRRARSRSRRTPGWW